MFNQKVMSYSAKPCIFIIRNHGNGSRGHTHHLYKKQQVESDPRLSEIQEKLNLKKSLRGGGGFTLTGPWTIYSV